MTVMATGRSSRSGLTVTVFGATGNIGRHLLQRFGRRGTVVVAPYRCDEYIVGSLRLLGDLGQINPLSFHLRDFPSIEKAVRHSDVVINAIGQNADSLNFKIEETNIDGAISIAKACRDAPNKPKLIHLSTVRADQGARSRYSRSKWVSERVVQEILPTSTIVRISSLFGLQDLLINGIGQFTNSLIGFPIPNWSHGIKQPIFIGDVSDALTLLTEDHNRIAPVYELYGPTAYTYKRLAEIFAFASFTKPRITPLPLSLFYLCGRISLDLWQSPFPMDYIQQLGENEHSPHPSVVRLPGMHDLGFLKLHTVEDHIGEISRGYRSRDHFHREVILPDHLLTDSVDQILPSSNFSQLK